MPEVTIAFSGSKGTPFLLQVMCARPKAASVSLPFTPLGRRSTSRTCVSVPPVTSASPPSIKLSAKALAFLMTWPVYSRYSEVSASPKATALAAMTCISGPPWRPGKTAEFSFFARSSSFVRIMPPRGPRRVLCVVVVATWQ